MLADLNIARKLCLLLILPMATFLFLVAVESIQRWKDIDELKFVERSLVVSFSAGELIHELQKERGYTSGYLGSKGKKFALELPDQINKSDAAYKKFVATLADANAHEADAFRPIFSTANAKFAEIANTRAAAKDTKEVGEAIHAIQNGTCKHIIHVEQAAETIESATVLARQSGDALQEQVKLASASTAQAQSIATASEEQSASSETIHRSLEDINRLALMTATAMDQATIILSELHNQIDVIVSVMNGLNNTTANKSIL